MHVLNVDSPADAAGPVAPVVSFSDWRRHGHQVANLARDIAQLLGFSDGSAARVEKAARQHDIGKSQLPNLFDESENLAEELSRPERELLRSHTWLGYRLLQNDPSPDEWVQETALLHHEWWDGTGYPLGLAQSEIPLVARIVSIADEYTALLEQHPHPSAWHVQDALAMIRKRSGRQFDPACVEALIALTEGGAADSTRDSVDATGVKI